MYLSVFLSYQLQQVKLFNEHQLFCGLVCIWGKRKSIIADLFENLLVVRSLIDTLSN